MVVLKFILPLLYLLFEHLLLFRQFLDFFCFLGILVELNDPNDSKQLDDSDCPGGCPGSLGLRRQLGHRGGRGCRKDHVSYKVNVEDYRNR